MIQDSDFQQLKDDVNDITDKLKPISDGIALLNNVLDTIKPQIGQAPNYLDVFTQKAIFNIVTIPLSVNIAGTGAATATNYGVFFIADRPYKILSISEVHGTAGTNAGAVTLQVERLQGTEALDAGDTLLSTAFNLKGTANTVQDGALAQNVTILNKGDRLALIDSGTLTDVADVVVTLQLRIE